MASITMKSVLLGSAAGILATAAAQAADLPVTKAAAVQYVKICSAYGTGFFEIPGTDMCMRIFAPQLGVEFSSSLPRDSLILTQNSKGGSVYTSQYFPAGVADYIGYTISARPGFDVRNATEYGTVRGVAQLHVDLKS